jgi:hypothetical protein
MLEEGGNTDLHGTEYQIYRRCLLGFLGSLSALTDVSMEGFLRLVGFGEMKITKRFLPYTMAKRLQPPITFLCLYLKMPVVWEIFGRQFSYLHEKVRLRNEVETAPLLRHSIAPLRCFQDEIEGSELNGVRFPYFKKQIRAKQRIGRVSGFSRKIELGAKTWAVWRLQADMVMTGSSRIKTGHNRFKRVPAIGIRELMSPATETFQIVFALAVRMPEVEESAGNRLALPIEYKTRHPAQSTRQTRFTEVRLQRRVRLEKRPRRFFGCEVKLLAHGGSGLKLDHFALSPEQRLNPR